MGKEPSLPLELIDSLEIAHIPLELLLCASVRFIYFMHMGVVCIMCMYIRILHMHIVLLRLEEPITSCRGLNENGSHQLTYLNDS